MAHGRDARITAVAVKVEIGISAKTPTAKTAETTAVRIKSADIENWYSSASIG